MTLNLKLPEDIILKPTITVFGVGGAGSNAINNMVRAKLQGAKFVAANTDAQSLEHSTADKKIQLGVTTTRGLGAGASPEVGQAAAEESESEIREALSGSNMVFVTAGMGGGTGTGAAPIIAKIAREEGVLTVGVVTKPFHFEGKYRMKLAEQGLKRMQENVDTLIIIPNQNLFHIANERTTFSDAFKMADEVLHSGVRGITDLMIMPGLINLDFADIKTVMSEMGKAMMGTGEASGEEDRAIRASEAAISNPLLDHRSVKGARGVLINITGGMDMTLFEVDAAANRIREEVGEDNNANIIFGSTFDEKLEGTIRVSVVATGIDAENYNFASKEASVNKIDKNNQKSKSQTNVLNGEDEVTRIIKDDEENEIAYSNKEDSANTLESYSTEGMQNSIEDNYQAQEKFDHVSSDQGQNEIYIEETSDNSLKPSEIDPIVREENSDNSEKKGSIFSRVFGAFRANKNYDYNNNDKSNTNNSSKKYHSINKTDDIANTKIKNKPTTRNLSNGEKVTQAKDSDDIYEIPTFLRRK